MEYLLFWAFSLDFGEVGIDIKKEIVECTYLGWRNSLIVGPELGVQSQFLIGGDEGFYFWDLGIGGVYFDDEFPSGGTRLNYALSLRVGKSIYDSLDIYVEGRHWSNGHVFHGRTKDTNPGWDGILVGLRYEF